jgi:cobalamin biosynthetic protein CobC
LIGTVALGDQPWADRTRGKLEQQAHRLDQVLVKAGFTIAGGTPLFRLARHPRALKLHAALAQRHIWCRRFDWADDLLRFGLPPDAASLDRLTVALSD